VVGEAMGRVALAQLVDVVPALRLLRLLRLLGVVRLVIGVCVVTVALRHCSPGLVWWQVPAREVDAGGGAQVGVVHASAELAGVEASPVEQGPLPNGLRLLLVLSGRLRGLRDPPR